MPETVAAVTAAVAAAAATTVGGVTVGSIIGKLLLSTALSLISTAIQGGFGGDGGNAPRPGTTLSAEAQSRVLTRFFGFGEYLVREGTGTSLAFKRPNASQSLYRVLVIDCDPVEEVSQHFLNGEAVSLNASGWVQDPVKWRDKIQIKVYNADDNQTAPAELTAAFPGVWTANHRLRGLSFVVIRQEPVSLSILQETYPNGANGEQWSAIVKAGAETYDPRTEATGYTDNAVLILLRVLTHPLGGGLTLDDFALDTWSAAADVADQLVTTPEGTVEATYRAAGAFAATSPGEGVGQLAELYNGLLACCEGRIYEDEETGKIGIVVPGTLAALDGMPLESRHLQSVNITVGDSLLEGVEATNASYTDPDFGFTGQTTPTYPVSVTSPNSIRTVPLKYCPSRTQAARIAYNTDLQHRSDAVLDGRANIAGCLLRPGGKARFTAIEIGPGDYMVETIERGDVSDPGTSFTAWKIPAGWGQFDPVADLTAKSLPAAIDADGEAIADPADFCAGSSDEAGTVRLSWGEPSAPGVLAEYEWSEAGAGQFGNRARLFPATDRVAEIDASAAPGDIDVRVRFAQLRGGVTGWTTVSAVDPLTFIGAPSTPGTSGLPASHDLSGQTNMDNQPFFASWATTECVRVVRVYVETGVTPPTVQAGADALVVDGDIPLPVGTGEVTGLSAGDTVYVQVEVENVSGQTALSSVHAIAIIDGGA